MKVMVGSKNPAKVDAVREILADYPHLKDAEVAGFEVDSLVGDQPRTLDDVMMGAMNRAKGAKEGADYGIGLEAGFMRVLGTKSGYMNVNACAIYDGANFHTGLSSAFETPDAEVMRLVVEDGLNFTDAALRAGLETTDAQTVAQKHGVIGTITKGRLDRKEYIKQSLRVALVHIDE